MNLEEEKVESFTREFHREYGDKSHLNDYCEVIDYDGKYDGLDYFQIGQRILLPIEVIHHDIPDIAISNLVRTLVNSEEDYLLSQLKGKAKRNEISHSSINDLSLESFRQWCSYVENPDHLFLPLDDEYFHELFDRQWEGELSTTADGSILVDDHEIETHWVPLSSGTENGYMISSTGIKIVQKWFDDSPGPDSFEHIREYDKFNLNRSLMLYFGNEVVRDEDEKDPQYREKIDFLYRIVLSQVLASSDDALLLRPEKELESK